jgi:FkbM family methyltransferase
MTQTLSARAGRLRSAGDKLQWGVRAVGVSAAARGALRLLKLRLRRPHESEIRLRSGPILGFDYPSQFPPVLVTFGDFIDPEFELLRLVVEPDSVVVDVGAAIGQFTVFAAMLPVRAVHAFEPSSTNVRTLKRNLDRNRVSDRVVVHQVALSNHEGEAMFETTERTWVSRLTTDASGAVGEKIPVRTLTRELDALGLDRVSVLKINVAGYEPKVLDGADEFLGRAGADILVLLISLDSLPWYERIAGHGYRFFFFDPPRRVLHELTRFDEELLRCRPWPARHVIAIHRDAMPERLSDTVGIVRARSKGTDKTDLPG